MTDAHVKLLACYFKRGVEESFGGKQLGASALRKQCIAYIVNHFSRVREQGEFKSLEKDLIMEVLLGLQM